MYQLKRAVWRFSPAVTWALYFFMSVFMSAPLCGLKWLLSDFENESLKFSFRQMFLFMLSHFQMYWSNCKSSLFPLTGRALVPSQTLRMPILAQCLVPNKACLPAHSPLFLTTPASLSHPLSNPPDLSFYLKMMMSYYSAVFLPAAITALSARSATSLKANWASVVSHLVVRMRRMAERQRC